MIDTNKLHPVLNKESILKTANAGELAQSPQDVLRRYQTYALTHVPLGDTSKQLANLQRVVAENKTCAIGTIVGPYGYGKTSTAVHLWNELRSKQIVAIPPFQWINLQQLINAVYYWVRFEFLQGPAKYVGPLDKLYERYGEQGFERLGDKLDEETKRDWFERGLLNLELRAEDVVQFFSETSELCEQAGYRGLAIFTDELQVTVAEYKPSRDQFFNDLFQIVKDTLDRPGHWALLVSMDDGTEGVISRLRADLQQRMQHSALYFRVKVVYNRREYPAELWSAFEKRFDFDGSAVILPETLEAIGQIAARDDLGAGPRMVTNALSLAVRHYEKNGTTYTPLNFVNDFLGGQVLFDQRGKFSTAVKKALGNNDIRSSQKNQDVIKLLAAFPAGCPETTLARFNLLEDFRAFPPLSRRELITQLSEGHTLRLLLEEERPPEYIEQRLTQEFVARFVPGQKYARMAAAGFLEHILLPGTFGNNWKPGKDKELQVGQVRYRLQSLVGTFDKAYPQRKLTLAVTSVPQSLAPNWEKLDAEADIELRFEFNYELSPSEPSQLLIAPLRPDIAIFQFNLQATAEESARIILPDILFDFYSAERLSPLLCLSLLHHLFQQSGVTPEDLNRIRVIAGPLQQYALTMLLGEQLQVNREEFDSPMVGHDRIKDLFKTQCRILYPNYQTLIKDSRWQQDLQQYNYALERIVNDEGVSIARGRRAWETTKTAAADAFRIPKLSLTRLETLLDTLGDLVVKEEYSGRQADSPIRLRFQPHPLEKQWLEQLDESKEKARHNGMEVPALFAIDLLRQTQEQGYTLEEMQEVLTLLQSRQFVAFDQRQGLLLRAVDAVDDLKAAIQDQLDTLGSNVHQLESSVPEFDTSRFPIAELRHRLAEAKARDELELLKNEVRQYNGTVLSFAQSRATTRLESYRQEIKGLHQRVQAGVPEWLSRPYPESPLQNLLEQQRHHYAGAYESTLQDIRQLAIQANSTLQELPDSPIEKIQTLQKAYPDLRKNSERLQTRLQSYSDNKDDLDAWRRVIQQVATFEKRTRQVSEQYKTDKWANVVATLWTMQRAKLEKANPLTIAGLHRDLQQQLNDLEKQLVSWLENRREDFERQRSRFELAFDEMGITTRLRIPFVEERPEESYSALAETVHQELVRHLGSLRRQLDQVLQKLRYAEKVQQVNLSGVEERTNQVLQRVELVTMKLSVPLLREIERAEVELLQPLQTATKQADLLAKTVQQALQKRDPDTRERQLLHLLQTIAVNDEADLYSLIMQSLDQEDQFIELPELLHNLQGLFQKNQIGIRIRLL